MFDLTRRVEFSASHRLHDPSLSEEDNVRLFGICNNRHGHGHNYVLDVTLRAPVDPRTGMVMDLNRLAALLDEMVVKELDHRHLSEDVPWLSGMITTAENVVARIWERLADHLDGKLHRLRLYESRDNFVDYHGPSGDGAGSGEGAASSGAGSSGSGSSGSGSSGAGSSGAGV